jgi:hypothetical protein
VPEEAAAAGGRAVEAQIGRATRCTRCQSILIGPARTCLIHGDQLDLGGRAPVLETVEDQRRTRR